MRYVAAYLLAVQGGIASPKAEDIKKILGSVGIEADKDKVKKVIGELNGKDIQDLMAKGQEKLASMPVGGGAAPAAGGAPAAGAPAEKEEKKEEKKVESEEESDEDMGFGLFD